MVIKIEDSLDTQETELPTFLNTENAFKNTSTQTIIWVVTNHELENLWQSGAVEAV